MVPRLSLARLDDPHRPPPRTWALELHETEHANLSHAHKQLTQTLAFATITLPTSVFNLVHYSVSLSFHLTFLKLLAFFLFVTTVASYVWKVRYLNRYTELRDLPGGNRIKGDEGFDLCASSLLSRVIEYAH